MAQTVLMWKRRAGAVEVDGQLRRAILQWAGSSARLQGLCMASSNFPLQLMDVHHQRRPAHGHPPAAHRTSPMISQVHALDALCFPPAGFGPVRRPAFLGTSSRSPACGRRHGLRRRVPCLALSILGFSSPPHHPSESRLQPLFKSRRPVFGVGRSDALAPGGHLSNRCSV